MTRAPLFKRAFQWRANLVALFGIVLLFLKWGEVESHWVFYVGAGLLFAGIAMRIVSQMYVHHRLEGPLDLTVSGPYAYVRNPLYIANTLMLCSLCFLSELVWLAPVAIVWGAVVYSFAIRYEESHLREAIGAHYEEYMRNVPRWLPRRTPWQAPWESPRDMRASRYLMPSVFAELHCFLWPIPFILKEML